jgi:peptide/nickel transport system substrate-binding protein
MTKPQGRFKRALAFGVTTLVLIAACSTGSPTPAPASQPAATTPTPSTAPTATGTPVASAPTATGTGTASTPPTATGTPTESAPASNPATPVAGGSPTPGGTLHILMTGDAANGGVSFQDMDPQRIYTGEDIAFFSATIMRSLTAYKYSTDPSEATTIVPDAATDTGTPNADFTEWKFTLKDGLKWQDGSDVSCADFAYGASRTFATDVIVGGPTYAIPYLDIPTADDGSSAYKGPYDGTGQDLFDKAVSCDGNTITYKLKQPVADFNFTTTLGFAAVPNPTDHPGADTGEGYDTAPWSDGPYMISNFTAGVGGNLTLDRNPNWSAAIDDYRAAYPDKWVVDFGIDPKVADPRLMTPTGDDQYALMYGLVQPENLATVFTDPHTAAPQFAGRAFSDYDPYTNYIWIRTDKVTDKAVRQAMGIALDRDAIRTANGGDFVGDYADGVIKPNIGQDYAPTGLWDVTTGEATADSLWGQAFTAKGDPAAAASVLTAAGITTPTTLTYDYVSTSPVGQQVAAIIQNSLINVKDANGAALFKVNLFGVSSGYYSYVLNDDTANEFGGSGWGADWPNASTVLPPLFTPEGGFDLSRTNKDSTPDFYAAIQDAMKMTDRTAQAAAWQELDKQASEEAYVIPTFFGLAQNIAGDHVGNLYRWAAYGSWPYAELYAIQ